MVDRVIVYPGAVPLETDILNGERFAMLGLAKFAAAMLGPSTAVNGLACTPTVPASLQVVIGPGEIYSMAAIDATAFGSLPADARSVLKQGIQLDSSTLAITPPGTAGQSIVDLVQAAYQDVDASPVALPYYNAANPAQAFTGPNNSGATQPTVRRGAVVVQLKAGIAAATGTQQAPAPDAGYVGLWTITVANGASQITAGNIALAASAPFVSPAAQFKEFSGQRTASTGYQRLPNGLILQWGTAVFPATNTTSSTAAVTFPIAFPQGCYFTLGASLGAASTQFGYVVSISTTQRSAAGANFAGDLNAPASAATINQPVGFNWLALGA